MHRRELRGLTQTQLVVAAVLVLALAVAAAFKVIV
jgi:hypothetical protein